MRAEWKTHVLWLSLRLLSAAWVLCASSDHLRLTVAESAETYRPVPDERKSDFSRRPEFVGPAFPESETQRWHIWGCSPIDGPDGKVHLFCARWPLEEGHYKGWQTHSEIAHAVADSAEGPFRFVDVVLRGRGGDKWNAQAPHNPTILRGGRGPGPSRSDDRQELDAAAVVRKVRAGGGD